MSLRKLCPVLVLSGMISPLLATDYHFNVADGDWYTPGNWSPGGPPQGGSGNHAFIDAGKTVTIAQDTDGGGSGFDIQDTFVGRGTGNVGTINQSAGMFNANNGWLFVGDRGGTGTWNVTGTGSISTGRLYVGGVRTDGGGSGGGNGTFTMNTTGTVTLTSDFSVGTRGATGNVVINNGTLNANTWAIIGETQNGEGGSTGSVIQNGGAVNFGATDAGGRFWIGSHESGALSASSGSYTLNNGTLTSRNIEIGRGSGYTGTFTQNGGSYHILGGNDDSIVGSAGGATGTWNMTGGQADVDNNWQIGGSGTGTLNMTGGTMNQNGWPVIGRFAGGVGTANISGGTFNQTAAGNRLIIGEEGTGTVNISGTANVVSAGGISVGHGATGNGTLNLNGGTVTAPFIAKSLGTAKINADGGTIKASVDQAEYFNVEDAGAGQAPTTTAMPASSIEIKAGGLKFDTNGFSVATAVALPGAGALTKQGAGTLALNGITTYTGGTFVTQGTLALGASGGLGGTGQIDVAAGATLNASASGLSLLAGQTLTGKGTVTGNVNVGPGTLAPGNSIGTETFANNLTLGATSTSNFEIIKLTLPDADLANVVGNLTLGGTLNVTSLGGTFANGDTFNLFDAASISGNFSTVNLPATTGTDYWVNNLTTNGTITFVPEPGTALLGVISLGLLARRRRRA